jgi:hypothetical protein
MSSLSLNNSFEEGPFHSIDTILDQLAENAEKDFITKSTAIRESIKSEFGINCNEEEYIYFGKVGVPLDSNYSRMAPAHCNEVLSQLVIVVEKLASELSIRLPFKAVPHRPFTYILSRDQLGTERPHLYPLEFPEASTAGESSARIMQKLYDRFLIGLTMLNCNLIRVGMSYRVRINRDLLAKPYLILKKIIFETPSPKISVSDQASISFEAVQEATNTQWNQQTI